MIKGADKAESACGSGHGRSGAMSTLSFSRVQICHDVTFSPFSLHDILELHVKRMYFPFTCGYFIAHHSPLLICSTN